MPTIECPPKDELARALAGEVDSETCEQISLHVNSCEDCLKRVAEIERDREAAADPAEQRADKAKRLQDRYGWIAVVVAWLLGIVAAEYIPIMTQSSKPSASETQDADIDSAPQPIIGENNPAIGENNPAAPKTD